MLGKEVPNKKQLLARDRCGRGAQNLAALQDVGISARRSSSALRFYGSCTLLAISQKKDPKTKPLNKYKLYTIVVLAGVCAVPLDRVYQTLPRSEFIAVITADQCDDSRVVREWHTDSY